jgi:hypothetical protein
MAYSSPVVFIETAVFTRRVQDHLSDDEYADLQFFLASAQTRERSSSSRVGFANCDRLAVGAANAAACE